MRRAWVFISATMSSVVRCSSPPRLEEELAVERDANAQYETFGRRGVMTSGRRFGRPPKPRTPPTVPAGRGNAPAGAGQIRPLTLAI